MQEEKARHNAEIKAVKERELKLKIDLELKKPLFLQYQEKAIRERKMRYTLSQTACKKESNEKMVQFPSKKMINSFVENGGPDPISLFVITTAPKSECNMNFVFNTGD